MGIEHEDHVENTFRTVKQGEMFLWRDVLFMKTKNVEGFFGPIANAVRMSDGSPELFGPYSEVRVVKCKVIIEED